MLHDQAIHDFDQARYLTGEEIATVYTVGLDDRSCHRRRRRYRLREEFERFADAYRVEMEAFAAMIARDAPALANIRDGVEAQRLAGAVIAFLRTGLPVSVDRDWRRP